MCVHTCTTDTHLLYICMHACTDAHTCLRLHACRRLHVHVDARPNIHTHFGEEHASYKRIKKVKRTHAICYDKTQHVNVQGKPFFSGYKITNNS